MTQTVENLYYFILEQHKIALPKYNNAITNQSYLESVYKNKILTFSLDEWPKYLPQHKYKNI